jgi:predicted short-subunit dehydrogenase-like oxidoreductase (DUF2520 family)
VAHSAGSISTLSATCSEFIFVLFLIKFSFDLVIVCKLRTLLLKALVAIAGDVPEERFFVMKSIRIVGDGKLGGALCNALAKMSWRIERPLGRTDDLQSAAYGVDVLAITTPDAAIATVARRIEPSEETLVVHLSGALTLGVLSPHPRRASMHPLASIPNRDLGARRLLDKCSMAVAGDRGVLKIVEALRANWFEIDEDNRALYHATACVAANHVTLIASQIERLSELCGVPKAAYLNMAKESIDNVLEMGAVQALTGPASRGDFETINMHIDVLPIEEKELYETLAKATAELAGRRYESKSKCD